MPVSEKELKQWCAAQYPDQLFLLKTLAAIPAPSHNEHQRAAFIADWLKRAGAESVHIDEAQNVVFPYRCAADTPLLLCTAHTDVVFPDTSTLPVREENGRLYAPGVGDDTANVVALMLFIRFLMTHPEQYTCPTLFVFNSCEEGLGNLKGIRQIMSDYSGRIGAMISLDLQSDSIITKAVGSERWEIVASTIGGHSYGDFGNASAIHRMSELICALWQQPVPQSENTKTTFNVGTISGGTSVNSIAQNASMTYEYRSDDPQCLAVMAAQFREILASVARPDVEFSVKSIGNRPCGSKIPESDHTKLIKRCRDALCSVYPGEPALRSGSTDANILLSLGIPAVTFGLYRGAGAHTRQEYVELDSLTPGLEIALRFFLEAFAVQ